MDPDQFTIDVFNKFNEHLKEDILSFIDDSPYLSLQFPLLENAPESDKVNEYIDGTLVLRLQANVKPNFYIDALDIVISQFLEGLAEEYVANIIDRFFLFIENNKIFNTLYNEHPELHPDIEVDVWEILMVNYHLKFKHKVNIHPKSKLIEDFQELKLK